MIAASILKARGFHNMIDVIGGFGQIKTPACLLLRKNVRTIVVRNKEFFYNLKLRLN